MIRILHLRSTAADFETRRSIEQLARGLGAGFSTEERTIGLGGTYRNSCSAMLALRRSGDESFNLIHTWDLVSLFVAAIGTSSRLIFTPGPEMSAAALHWLRAIMGHRDVQVICPTATLRRQCIERGVALERCHLIRPGVDFARIRHRRDRDLRTRLGFKDDETVILLAGESTRPANHRLGVWAAAILNEVDSRYRALIWGRGPEAAAVARFTRRIGQQGFVALADDRLHRPLEFEELLPAADVILVTADGPVATLPIAFSMAAALPIISTVSYTVGELLEDRHTALMVPKPQPRALAQRVLDLRQSTSLQWTISDMARTEAYEYFALTRFLRQYRAAYTQAAGGEAVQIPAEAPGAGLRFHGRG